jgi:ABC-type maltose transport system permease subunit
MAPGNIAVWTLLLLGGIVMVMPFVYMLAASFKFNHEIYELSLLPREATLDNYRRLFRTLGLPALVRQFAADRHRDDGFGALLRQPGRLHPGQVPVSRALSRVHCHTEHAHDPDGNAGAALVFHGQELRVAGHLLGRRVSRADDRVSALS